MPMSSELENALKAIANKELASVPEGDEKNFATSLSLFAKDIDKIMKNVDRTKYTFDQGVAKSRLELAKFLDQIPQSELTVDRLRKLYRMDEADAEHLIEVVKEVRKQIDGLREDMTDAEYRIKEFVENWKAEAAKLPFILGKQVLDQSKAFEEWRMMQHKTGMEVNKDITDLTAAGAAAGQSFAEVGASVTVLRKTGITEITPALVEDTGKLSVMMGIDAPRAAEQMAKRMQMLNMSSEDVLAVTTNLANTQSAFGLSSEETMGIFDQLGPVMMAVYQKGGAANNQFEAKVASVVGTMKKLGIDSKYAVDSLKKAIMPTTDDMAGLAIQAGMTGHSIQELMDMASQEPEKYAEIQAQMADDIVRKAGNNPYTMRQLAETYGVPLEMVMKANQKEVKAHGGLLKEYQTTRQKAEANAKQFKQANDVWATALSDFGKGWDTLKKQLTGAWLTAIRPVVGSVLAVIGHVFAALIKVAGFILDTPGATKALALIGGGVAVIGSVMFLAKTIAGIRSAFAGFVSAAASFQRKASTPLGGEAGKPGLGSKLYGLASGKVKGAAGGVNVLATAGIVGGTAAAGHGLYRIHDINRQVEEVNADKSLSPTEKADKIKALEEEKKGAKTEAITGTGVAVVSGLVRFRGAIGKGLQKIPLPGKWGKATRGIGKLLEKSGGVPIEGPMAGAGDLSKGAPVSIIGISPTVMSALCECMGGGSGTATTGAPTSGAVGTASKSALGFAKGGKLGSILKIGAITAGTAAAAYGAVKLTEKVTEGKEGRVEEAVAKAKPEVPPTLGVSPTMKRKALESFAEKQKLKPKPKEDNLKMFRALSPVGIALTAPLVAEKMGGYLKTKGFPNMLKSYGKSFEGMHEKIASKILAATATALPPALKKQALSMSSYLDQMSQAAKADALKQMETAKAKAKFAPTPKPPAPPKEASETAKLEEQIKALSAGNVLVEKQLRQQMAGALELARQRDEAITKGASSAAGGGGTPGVSETGGGGGVPSPAPGVSPVSTSSAPDTSGGGTVSVLSLGTSPTSPTSPTTPTSPTSPTTTMGVPTSSGSPGVTPPVASPPSPAIGVSPKKQSQTGSISVGVGASVPEAGPAAPTTPADTGKAAEVIKFTSGTTPESRDLNKLHPKLLQSFVGAASEYKEKTKRPVTLNSGWRSQESQTRLYKRFLAHDPHVPAAGEKVGSHGGYAVDVQEAKELDSMGLLKKYGLWRPLGEGDWMHVQLAGTYTNHRLGGWLQQGKAPADPEFGGGGSSPSSGGAKGAMGGGTDIYIDDSTRNQNDRSRVEAMVAGASAVASPAAQKFLASLIPKQSPGISPFVPFKPQSVTALPSATSALSKGSPSVAEMATATRTLPSVVSTLTSALSKGMGLSSMSAGMGLAPQSEDVGMSTAAKGIGLPPHAKGIGLPPHAKGMGLAPQSEDVGMSTAATGGRVATLMSRFGMGGKQESRVQSQGPILDAKMVTLISVAKQQLNVQEQIYELLAKKMGGPPLKKSTGEKITGELASAVRQSSQLVAGGAPQRVSAGLVDRASSW